MNSKSNCCPMEVNVDEKIKEDKKEEEKMCYI